MLQRSPLQRPDRSLLERSVGPLTAGGIRQSVFTLISTAMGGGVLCLPFAMMEAGWLLGCLLLLTSACISFFSMLMLIESANKTRKYSYASLLAHVMGPWTAPALDLIMIFYGTGALIAYFIFLGDFVPHIVQAAGYPSIERRFAIMATLAIAMPLAFPQKLSALKYVSPISTMSLLFTALVVIFRAPQNHDALEDKAFDAGHFSSQLLRCFTITLFAFVCHLNVVPVAGEMVEPTPLRIEKVASRVSILLFIFYALIGVLGYYSFGSSVSQNFMNNYQPDDKLSSISRLMLTLSLFCCLPINANPTAHAIVHFALATELAPQPSANQGPLITDIEPLRKVRIGGSAVVLSVAAVVACYVPGAADVVGILGGSLGNLLMMVCPAIIYKGVFKGQLSTARTIALGMMVCSSILCFIAVAFSLSKLLG